MDLIDATVEELIELLGEFDTESRAAKELQRRGDEVLPALRLAYEAGELEIHRYAQVLAGTPRGRDELYRLWPNHPDGFDMVLSALLFNGPIEERVVDLVLELLELGEVERELARGWIRSGRLLLDEETRAQDDEQQGHSSGGELYRRFLIGESETTARASALGIAAVLPDPQTFVPLLVEALGIDGRTPAVCDALSIYGPDAKVALPRLLELLAAEPPRHRSHLLRAIGHVAFRDPGVLDALRALRAPLEIKDSEPALIEALLETISMIEEPELLGGPPPRSREPVLSDLLQRLDRRGAAHLPRTSAAPRSQRAAREVQRMADSALLEKAIEAYPLEDDECHASNLRRIILRQTEVLDSQAGREALARFLVEAKPGTAEFFGLIEAATDLDLEEPADHLRSLWVGGETPLRRELAGYFGAIGDEESIESLGSALFEAIPDDPYLAEHAYRALGQIGGPRTRRLWLAALSDPRVGYRSHLDQGLRSAALNSLIKLGDAESVQAVCRELRDAPLNTQEFNLWAVTQLDDMTVVPDALAAMKRLLARPRQRSVGNSIWRSLFRRFFGWLDRLGCGDEPGTLKLVARARSPKVWATLSAADRQFVNRRYGLPV